MVELFCSIPCRLCPKNTRRRAPHRCVWCLAATARFGARLFHVNQPYPNFISEDLQLGVFIYSVFFNNCAEPLPPPHHPGLISHLACSSCCVPFHPAWKGINIYIHSSGVLVRFTDGSLTVVSGASHFLPSARSNVRCSYFQGRHAIVDGDPEDAFADAGVVAVEGEVAVRMK